jgi:hypothetical protein
MGRIRRPTTSNDVLVTAADVIAGRSSVPLQNDLLPAKGGLGSLIERIAMRRRVRRADRIVRLAFRLPGSGRSLQRTKAEATGVAGAIREDGALVVWLMRADWTAITIVSRHRGVHFVESPYGEMHGAVRGADLAQIVRHFDIGAEDMKRMREALSKPPQDPYSGWDRRTW